MITVTGASGKLGRATAQELGLRVQPQQVTLGTRTPAAIDDLRQQGFRVATVDFDRPGTVEEALSGSRSVMVICGHGTNDKRIQQHKAVIDIARPMGARFFYTSFTNPVRSSLFPFAQAHAATESYARESGIAHTFLRNNHYFENLESALRRALSTGELALPGARGKVAYIARQDVGAASAGALTLEQPETAYELTGTQALDLFEVAELAADVWGQHIAARDMPAGEYSSLLAARGMPGFVVEAQVNLRLACGAGEYEAVRPDAQLLAGRPLLSMRDYLRTLAAAVAPAA
ncbi:NAD(P)H-binding protein [Ramlibacter sp. AW1]|uniref:NAD(P)H-binding protein n=1 Tax=Ramlibacter aurantiacus TaxID=2801330 RepID=A0A936ZQD6_9BURK|nr:NAD(P)H-binding protein [Ramlibacter aurantiacus]MBL0419085.1 NAD(P)H-binding protein [Ramlibacter aurantiacus]